MMQGYYSNGFALEMCMFSAQFISILTVCQLLSRNMLSKNFWGGGGGGGGGGGVKTPPPPSLNYGFASLLHT